MHLPSWTQHRISYEVRVTRTRLWLGLEKMSCKVLVLPPGKDQDCRSWETLQGTTVSPQGSLEIGTIPGWHHHGLGSASGFRSWESRVLPEIDCCIVLYYIKCLSVTHVWDVHAGMVVLITTNDTAPYLLLTFAFACTAVLRFAQRYNGEVQDSMQISMQTATC